jgi:hypothetical protein
MVYKTKFLKQVVVNDYDPSADENKTFDLTNEALAALWITVKGDLVKANVCIDDILASLTQIDVWHGGFNVLHYQHPVDALVMNCKLKGAKPYLVNSSQTIDDVTGITFPLLFGAPYLNQQMALPASESNRKRLTLGLDIATANLDDLLIDICEVLLPDTPTMGCIKQEEVAVSAKGTGDQDLWLQTNWDLLKLNIYSPTVPTGATYTSTVERAGLEINDFAFGYKYVPWEILHGELMDELEGSAMGVEDHVHLDPSSGSTGMPTDLETWIAHYGELDFFMKYDMKWKAPLAGASTAKLKYNAGVDEAFRIATANYVPASMLEY